MIRLQVDGQKIAMELDIGASTSVAGKNEWEEATGKLIKWEKTPSRLRTFGGKVIEPIGVAYVQVSYKKQSRRLPIVLTSEPGPILMGRN